MTEFKGTPGPWELVESDDGHEIHMASKLASPGFYDSHHVVNYDNGCTADDEDIGQDQVGEAEANARLIAAAPELLEALQSLVANLAEGDFISTTRIDAARAAIARALGSEAGR